MTLLTQLPLVLEKSLKVWNIRERQLNSSQNCKLAVIDYGFFFPLRIKSCVVGEPEGIISDLLICTVKNYA